MINTISDIVIALGTAGMAVAAWIALRSWRKEFIGKKKIELAAEIMSSVLEFQDILTSARLTAYTPMNLAEIEKWLIKVNDSKEGIPGSIKWPIYRDRLNYLMPIHRLNTSADTVDDFSKVLNKSLMYWPEDLFKLLVELHSFLGKIRYASEMLYENPNVREYWDIAFANENATDETSKRIFEIGDEIKINLEPLYKDLRTAWIKPTKDKNAKVDQPV